MRTEVCACGGLITAPSLRQSQPYVEAHNATILHRLWRSMSTRVPLHVPDEFLAELLPTGQPTYHDPRRRRPTADTASVDVSGCSGGASAGDVGGVV